MCRHNLYEVLMYYLFTTPSVSSDSVITTGNRVQRQNLFMAFKRVPLYYGSNIGSTVYCRGEAHRYTVPLFLLSRPRLIRQRYTERRRLHSLGIIYMFFSEKNPVYRDRTHIPPCQKVARLPLSYQGDWSSTCVIY